MSGAAARPELRTGRLARVLPLLAGAAAIVVGSVALAGLGPLAIVLGAGLLAWAVAGAPDRRRALTGAALRVAPRSR